MRVNLSGTVQIMRRTWAVVLMAHPVDEALPEPPPKRLPGKQPERRLRLLPPPEEG